MFNLIHMLNEPNHIKITLIISATSECEVRRMYNVQVRQSPPYLSVYDNIISLRNFMCEDFDSTL